MRAYLGISLRKDVFRPGSTISAGEVLELLNELPDDSAFIAALKASSPDPSGALAADESPTISAFRLRRRWRGWTTDRELLAQIRDAYAKTAFPRPSDDPSGFGGRTVVDLDHMPI